jgi:5-methylcytosine-specific restriction endonuclease McrA
MNRWNIPEWRETLVLERDKDCVYCRATFDRLSPRARPTWEHIINDLQMITRENIARCCMSCNSSKGEAAGGVARLGLLQEPQHYEGTGCRGSEGATALHRTLSLDGKCLPSLSQYSLAVLRALTFVFA